MKILYLTPHVPRATKIRAYAHVRGLRDAGQAVTIATLQRSADDAHYIQRLRDDGFEVLAAPLGRPALLANAVRALPTARPLQSRLLWSQALLEQIQRHIHHSPPDVIHVEHLRMAEYGLRLRGAVIWDAVDNLTWLFTGAAAHSRSHLWRTLARVEVPRLRRYEKTLTAHFPLTLVISARDQALFQAENAYADRVHIAPIGIAMQRAPEVVRADQTLILTGTMDYHPNVAAAVYCVKHILPLIQQQHPHVHLQIVGANPVSAVRRLASDAVTVTGFVPSITEYLSAAAVALAPVTYGSGIQIKVLEAFCAGTPLVATTAALRGLDVRDGYEVLIGDTPSDFAAAVARLLADPALRQRIGQAGQLYVTRNHDLKHTTQRLLALYEQAVSTARR